MPRVLFIIHTSTVFVECFRLAKLLKAEGIEPVVGFAYDHWSVSAFVKECVDAGVQVYRPEERPIQTKTLAGTLPVSYTHLTLPTKRIV